MDISLLPQEIFEEICLFLDVSDILTCCLVCTAWRNTLNNNRVWGSFYRTKFGVPKSDSELIIGDNIVNPGFVIPENHSLRLSDVCEWRLRFMQDVHIFKNWRNGRYVAKIITRINVGEIVESSGNTIVIPNNEMRSFIPWSVGDNFAKGRVVPFSLNNMLASFFKFYHDKVVIAQCTLLQVFSKTQGNDFTLSHRFLFNKSSEDSINIPSSPDVTEWYETAVGLYPCDINICCDHDGKYFVGVILEGDLNFAKLHVWNIMSGNKCIEQALPYLNCLIIDIRFTINNSKLILLLQVIEADKKCTKIYCYDLNILSYTNMFIHFDYALPLVLVSDPYILSADTTGHNLFLWRIFDGQLLHSWSSDKYLNPMVVQFASSFILICEYAPYSDTVKVYSTKTLKTVHEFSTGFIVINLTLVRSNLMLIRGAREFGLWDITVGSKLYSINEIFLGRHVIWTNYNFSKLVIETEGNELFLFDFW